MSVEVLVIAEHDGREIDPITFDLLSWGSQIATENNWRLGVLVSGFEVGAFLEGFHRSGADVIFVLDDPRLQQYSAPRYLEANADAVKQTKPQLVLLGHSYFGIEMGGALAVTLQAPLVSNCLSIAKIEDGFEVIRPMFGGALLTRLHVQSPPPILVSMQKGSAAAKRTQTKVPEIVRLTVPVGTDTPKIRVIQEQQPAFREDITKAKTLVAIGRGIGRENKIPLFRELAEELGGTLAASRPIVDMGWLPVDHQVGLSGRTVKPNVYLACGISGAAQHIAGMKDAGLIIAINKDPLAPIFQVAHYGVVGDLFEIAHALLELAKKQK
jgi:electron transfer flavoprotein alpha subunit